jgi:SAM-dependent methyltransferase
MPVPFVALYVPATSENFEEQAYLKANPDVAQAVRNGQFRDGRHHFQMYGCNERRQLRRTEGFASLDRLRAFKMTRVEPLLRLELPYERRGGKYDFLTSELRAQTRVSDPEVVSSNVYEGAIDAMIRDLSDGLLLDCGAGRRDVYYSNVVNFETVDYDTTDVVGVGEVLPFRDNAFDAVISASVLEHVRNPWRCATEMARVLKRGGRLICLVPFLLPYHAYPHHYYNMTREGLRALFDDSLVIDDQRVLASELPVWSLTSIVQSWATGLPEPARQSFLSLQLKDLLVPATNFLDQNWVKQLTPAKNFELACATALFAHKP